MGYELREHTADVAVWAAGPTLEAAFGSVADGLAAACVDDVPEPDRTDPARERALGLRAESLEALLFDYLDELIYRRDVEHGLPVDNRVEAIERTGETEWTLEASYWSIPLSEIVAREIKAVTYAEMSIEETSDGWECYVVFDV